MTIELLNCFLLLNNRHRHGVANKIIITNILTIHDELNKNKIENSMNRFHSL